MNLQQVQALAAYTEAVAEKLEALTKRLIAVEERLRVLEHLETKRHLGLTDAERWGDQC